MRGPLGAGFHHSRLRPVGSNGPRRPAQIFFHVDDCLKCSSERQTSGHSEPACLPYPTRPHPTSAKNTEERALWFSEPQPVPRAAELSPLPEQFLPCPLSISPRGRCSKTPQPERLRHTGHRSLSWCWRCKVPTRCQQGGVRAPLLVHSCHLLTVSPPGGRGRGTLWSLSYKALPPIHEASTFLT